MRYITCSIATAVVFLCGILLHNVSCQDSCANNDRQNNMTYCLYQTYQLLVNDGAVWFGSQFLNNCPNGTTEWDINCYFPGFDPNLLTMASRLFAPGTFDQSHIQQFLVVTYETHPEPYSGCRATFNPTEPRMIDIHPAMEAIAPWEAHFKPSINWTISSSEKYTIIMVDVAFSKLHLLQINYPDGLDIVPYIPPSNFRFIPNPFAFLLFRQVTPNLEINEKWQEFFKNKQKLPTFNIIEFSKDNRLTDLVSVNWVSISTDVTISDTHKDFVNNCPLFLNDVAKLKDTTFIPKNAKFTVWMDVHYNSVAMNFVVCNQKCDYKNTSFFLNPLNGLEVTPETTLNAPQITLIMGKINPQGTKDFKGTYHTLLMVDPDVPDSSIGTHSRPLAHWLVLNIPEGIVNSGVTLFGYRGPRPPTPKHTYYFLLYKQSSLIQVQNNTQLYGTVCAKYSEPRCQFDIQNFVNDNKLVLVSATWMTASTDAYVLHSLIENKFASEADICQERPLYSNCTLVSHGSSLQKPWFLFILVIAFLIY